MIQYIVDRRKKILLVGLCLYLGIVLIATVFARTPEPKRLYELIPFWSWREAVREICRDKSWFMLRQILVNVVMLMPVGIALRHCFHIRMRDGLLFGFFFSLFIELAQLIFCLGLFEWDDMIHNAVGCMLGIWFMKRAEEL